MRGKNLFWNKLRLVHPKNLEKEVHIYGYHFSWKSHILLMLGALVGISAVGVLFRLKAFYFTVVVIAVVVTLPVLVLDMYKKMYEQKRFADVTSYMEQMLYSFQKTGKVVSALKETREVYAEGQMRRCIDDALLHMELGKPTGTEGILRESLQMIETCYGCTKLSMVHNLLGSTEEYGGEVEDSIVLTLEDIERWKKRGYQLQAEKSKSHVDNIISIVVATLLCAIALYVLDAMKQMFAVSSTFDIFQIPVIQVSSMLFILILLRIFVKSSRNLTDDWLQDIELHDSTYILRSYDTVMNYDDGKAKKKSMLLACVPLILAAILFLLGQRVPGLLCLAVGAFFMAQHRIGYHLAKKDVTEEMYLALPQWLLEMALLLQNNNVQVSIAKSLEGAPAVLSKELGLLIGRLEEQPGQLQAYTAFCSNFDLPEMTSCMKMLHAFSENGTGNVSVQMNHLLERVGQMQDRTDHIRNENIAFHMKLIFSYPVVAATAKLLIDLSIGMVLMMQILGGIGGVR